MIQTVHGVASDRGIREENEDCALAQWPVFAVADGVGGHSGGAAASAAVVNALGQVGAVRAVSDIDSVLSAARADVEHLRHRGRAPGSTVSGVVFTEAHPPRALVFNVGDSRTYISRSHHLFQITKDHSFVQELADEGVMSEDEARCSRQRNIITRALGAGSPDRRVDYFEVVLAVGDRFLACTDGVCATLTPQQISDVLNAGLDPQATASALVQTALKEGTCDNASAVVVDVTSTCGVDESLIWERGED